MRAWMAMVVSVTMIGCAAQTPPPAPAPDVPFLRNPTAPLASQADVVAADLAGDWVVRQAAGSRWPTFVETAAFIVDGDDIIVPPTSRLCDPHSPCHFNINPMRYVPIAAGRWRAEVPVSSPTDGLPSEIWVYWMDFDDRTMAIGGPDGYMVAVLDRNATGGGDRIIAARDILDWFGYDLTRLKEVSQ